jgi:hypothetical protein
MWTVTASTLGTLVIIATLLLARRNLRAGRGDRRGAWRLFCFGFAALLAAWIVGARHYSSVLIEDDRFFEFVGYGLRRIGLIWLLYIALEPYVRRYAPGILMSWTRVLGGQFVDARVGRDVLAGVVVGVGLGLLNLCYYLVPLMLGEPPGQPRSTNLRMLLDTSSAVGLILGMIPNNLSNGLFVAIAFGVGRALTRRTWGGAMLAAIMFGIFVLGETGTQRLAIFIFVAAFVTPLVATLIYFGILPVVIAFFVNQVLGNAPLTLQSSMPFAPVSFWVMGLVLGLAVFGFYASRGGQPLFGRVLAE